MYEVLAAFRVQVTEMPLSLLFAWLRAGGCDLHLHASTASARTFPARMCPHVHYSHLLHKVMLSEGHARGTAHMRNRSKQAVTIVTTVA